ncbi:tRNA dihydrouridine synthase A [Klebsiella variicola]|nr:tRNA dihydrouridine synthase A [Klebsiella variicola]
MLDWTDRHCRYFLRLLSRHTLLYTEMVTTGRLFTAKVIIWPIAKKSTRLLCSSAAAIRRPWRSARSWQKRVATMRSISTSAAPPTRAERDVWRLSDGQCATSGRLHQGDARCGVDSVTVKTRIGIDDQDSYEFLCDFIETVSGKGECEMFIIHARKAWLSGLSPKENREIPPLDYPRVWQLKRDFPHLTMAINGGIKSLDEARLQLEHMDGVMVGREAYQNPGILASVDREIFGIAGADADPVAVVRAMYPYMSASSAMAPIWAILPAICWAVSGHPRRSPVASLPERERA